MDRPAETLSNHTSTKTAVSGVREEVSHDRQASTEHSAEVQPNGSSAPSVAAGTVKGKEVSRRLGTLLYGVTALAILMSTAAIWGWMRPAPSKHVVRYGLVFDSTETMAQGSAWVGRLAIS